MSVSRQPDLVPERSGRTRTWKVDAPNRVLSQDPPRLLKRMSDGRVFDLDEVRYGDLPRRWIKVGRSKKQDIVVPGKRVSALQCFLFRDRTTGRLYVMDADSKNGTAVRTVMGNVAAPSVESDEMVEIVSGAVLSVADRHLLACGQAGAEQKPVVSGEDLDQVLRGAVPIFGSRRKAARALNVKRRTFTRWLRTRKFDPEVNPVGEVDGEDGDEFDDTTEDGLGDE